MSRWVLYPAARNVRSWSTSPSSEKLFDRSMMLRMSFPSSLSIFIRLFLFATNSPQILFRLPAVTLTRSLSFQGSAAMTHGGNSRCNTKYTAFSVLGSKISSMIR